MKEYAGFTKIYSITSFLNKYHYQKYNLKTENEILYLGCDITDFKRVKKQKLLKNVILIGNKLLNKGVLEYFEIAKVFPNLIFHIVGSEDGAIDLLKEIEKKSLKNVIFHKYLSKPKLIELLGNIDLHILLSRSEGFPKVILETSSMGIPSILYPDYGCEEWIVDGKDGFIVDNISQAVDVIKK